MSDEKEAAQRPNGVFDDGPARQVWPWLALSVVLLVGIALGWALSHAPKFAAKPADVPAPAPAFSSASVPAPTPAAGPAPAPTVIAVEPEAQVEWFANRGPALPVYTVGGLRLSLTAKSNDDIPFASLHLVGPGNAAYDLDGQANGITANMSFMVGRLDPDNPTPQVIVSSSSDAVQFNTSVDVLTLQNGTWRRVDLNEWVDEDVGEYPKDIDGDGRPDFAYRDNEFSNAFWEPGKSLAFDRIEVFTPPAFIDVIGDKAVNVSGKPGFRNAHKKFLEPARKACREGSNMACATFVAVAARLGRSDEAWSEMLANYDRKAGWELRTGCRTRQAPDGKCSKADTIKFATFPEALRWFLGARGYLPPMVLPPAPGARGPGFDCAKADGDIQRLICADAGLAAQDRDLAIAYARALVLVPDAAGAKRDQQAFLQVRDTAGPDHGALAALYSQRIAQLRRQITQAGFEP